MRILVLLLSIALIFLGIAAVMYVDSQSAEAKNSPSYKYAQQKNDIFTKKYSMHEIDSLTAAYNYPFTINNAVKTSAADSSGYVIKKL